MLTIYMRLYQFIFFLGVLVCSPAWVHAQAADTLKISAKPSKGKQTVLYGQASFYAAKFQGRKTANGEIFDHKKMTAACNSLPLGTWIKVTNLRNGKIVQLKVNDRLHHKTRRLVDLTKAAAQKLGFVKQGLTRVKVEVIKQKKNKK